MLGVGSNSRIFDYTGIFLSKNSISEFHFSLFGTRPNIDFEVGNDPFQWFPMETFESFVSH